MEDPQKTLQSICQSDIAHLRYQHTALDVPEDVDGGLMAHFNGPNLDFEANSSTLSTSADGIEHRRPDDTREHLSSVSDFFLRNHKHSSPPRSLFIGFVFSLVIPTFQLHHCCGVRGSYDCSSSLCLLPAERKGH